MLTYKDIFRNSPPKLNMSQIDSFGCSVCLENFTSGGSHRIVSLKCGHFFGRSCIERWLTQTKNCPECKQRCTQRDFREIYATKIVVVDNTNEVELQLQNAKYKMELDQSKAINAEIFQQLPFKDAKFAN